MANKKPVKTLTIPESLHAQLRLLAAQKKVRLQALVIPALGKLVAK